MMRKERRYETMSAISSERLHQTSVDQAGHKQRGFKHVGRNFDLLWLKLPLVTKVTSIKVFEVSVMFCSQITSKMANNSSCRTLVTILCLG